jgi:NO-binding membrane sensor protein with MHYT domain
LLEIELMAHGLINPALAYAASCLGLGLGLSAASRARAASSAVHRGTWLLVAALAIGGTGIWAMRFLAMLGFAVRDMPIHHDVPLTVVGAVVAVGAVTVGLGLANVAGRPAWLVGGGLVSCVGVVAVYYLGMVSMRMTGEVGYTGWLVALFTGLTLAALTATMWLSRTAYGLLPTAVAALAMGGVMVLLHYVGMAAVSVTGIAGPAPGGTATEEMFGPVVMVVVGLTIVLAFIVSMWPTEDEIRAQDELDERIRRQADAAR